MMRQTDRKMEARQIGVELGRRLQLLQSFLEFQIAEEGLALQQMERGESGGESRQTFERGAKTGFAQTQVCKAETVQRRRVRRRGVDRLFELLHGFLITSQPGEPNAAKLGRLH